MGEPPGGRGGLARRRRSGPRSIFSITAGSICRGYKIPDRFLFLSELPRSPSGKLLRRALREMMAESPERTSGREPIGSILDSREIRCHGGQAFVEDPHDLIDLPSVDDQRRRVQQVVSCHAVDGPRTWIRHQTARQRGIADSRRDAPRRWERLFRRPVADELDSKQESQPAHVADHLVPLGELAQLLLEVLTDRRRVLDESDGRGCSGAPRRPTAHDIGLPDEVCPMTKEPLRERTSPTNSGLARTAPSGA